MRQPGQSFSRERLLEHVWDNRYRGRSNVIEVYIRYLRDKIDRPFGVSSIETVRGVGYRLHLNGRPMKRLPLKLKLTLAFAAAMAILLVATGLFVRLRLEAELRRLDRSQPALPGRPRRGTRAPRRLAGWASTVAAGWSSATSGSRRSSTSGAA